MSPDPNTVAFVACVAKKLDVPAAAKDLYVSDWFVKARAFAEASAARWFILSAMHGLVHPDSIIAPYEKSMHDMNSMQRSAWANRVKDQLRVQLPPCHKIIMLAGLTYRAGLMEFLGKRAEEVEVPMEGLSIGRQLQWLGNARGAV